MWRPTRLHHEAAIVFTLIFFMLWRWHIFYRILIRSRVLLSCCSRSSSGFRRGQSKRFPDVFDFWATNQQDETVWSLFISDPHLPLSFTWVFNSIQIDSIVTCEPSPWIRHNSSTNRGGEVKVWSYSETVQWEVKGQVKWIIKWFTAAFEQNGGALRSMTGERLIPD